MHSQKCVLVRKRELDESLAQAPALGRRMLKPFASFAIGSGLPFKILEDTNVSNDAEVHVHDADLWLCLEGNPVFTYGGELVHPRIKVRKDGTEDPRELFAKEIRGGETATLSPGDWLYVPAGEPHQHSAQGTARLVIVKISVC